MERALDLALATSESEDDQARTHTDTQTRAHTRTHMHACTHTHTHAHTHERTQEQTRGEQEGEDQPRRMPGIRRIALHVRCIQPVCYLNTCSCSLNINTSPFVAGLLPGAERRKFGCDVCYLNNFTRSCFAHLSAYKYWRAQFLFLLFPEFMS
jgi:hypothetical protein